MMVANTYSIKYRDQIDVLNLNEVGLAHKMILKYFRSRKTNEQEYNFIFSIE